MSSEKDKKEVRKRWIEKLSSHSTLSRSYTTNTSKTEEEKALIRLALHRSPFFTCMDEEQIERFIKVAELRTYAPGEMVILEGKIDNEEGTMEGSEEETNDYVMVDLEQHNPLEDAASTLKQDSSAETLVVGPQNVENVGPADVEEVDDTFLDENGGTEPVREAVRIVAEVAATKQILLDMEQVSKNAKTKRESMSGQVSCVYAIQSGNADVWHENFNTASLGPGHIFGEGGFLFHRQHSASVVASPYTDLSCWVVPIHVFMSYVLPSMHMMNKFVKYASRETESGEPYMTMVSCEKVYTCTLFCVTYSHGCLCFAFARMTLYSALRMRTAIPRVNLMWDTGWLAPIAFFERQRGFKRLTWPIFVCFTF
jgi:CRP-like cAMP-binding protein